MAGFNRNIITQADITQLHAAQSPAELPKTFDVSPPAGAAPPDEAVASLVTTGAAARGRAKGAHTTAGRSETAGAPGGVAVPTEDDYLTKLLKYVPLEVLGAYLFIAGVIDSNVTKPHDHAWWLGGLLIAILLLTVVYDIRVLSVVRPAQIAMSVVGLAIYVFATGGWFATTTWYEHWYAALALPLFGLLVAIVKLGPLPTAGDAQRA